MTACNAKILIVTPEFPPEHWGGLARTAFKVATHAANMGLETEVAKLTVDWSRTILLDENRKTATNGLITIHDIVVGRENLKFDERDLWDCPHNLSLQMMFQSLEYLAAGKNYDLFQSFFLYPVGYVTGILARKLNKPMISCVVGNDVNRYFFSPEKVAVCKSGLENSDYVVAMSQDLIDLANALSPIAEKSSVIYNSVEISGKSWSLRPRGEGCLTIGCGGIFKYAKGLPYIFKTVASLSEKWNIRLELRGILRDSERWAFDDMLNKTQIHQKVVLLEPSPHNAISEWLSSLDVFVLPSVTEGCPNILMEALAAGVPCVATAVGAVPELIEDGISGLIVQPGDSSGLAQAVDKILGDNKLAKTLGEGGRQKMKVFSLARERNSWEKVYKRFVRI
ncbi:MAG: glycosyltransferase family 4 protein [Pseudomonadota bacterium]